VRGKPGARSRSGKRSGKPKITLVKDQIKDQVKDHDIVLIRFLNFFNHVH
jgi:hypothetical protein